MKRLAPPISILLLGLLLAACGASPAPTEMAVVRTLTPPPTDAAGPTATAEPTPDPMQGWEKL